MPALLKPPPETAETTPISWRDTRFGPIPLHPAIALVEEVIADILDPEMVAVDRSGVRAETLAALADRTDYLRIAVPEEAGGRTLPQPVVSEMAQLIAGACPSTFQIAAQHSTPINWIVKSGSPELRDLLGPLARGERIGGSAFGHMTAWPNRVPLKASRVDGGWVVDGVAPWFSGDGLVSVLALAAVVEDERLGLHAIVELPHARISPRPVAVSAIDGARTAALHFDRLFISEEHVIETFALDGWNIGGAGPPVNAAALGLARRALLFAIERLPDEPALQQIAEEIGVLLAVAYGPAVPRDAGDSDLDLRARSIAVAIAASNAAILAGGGSVLLSSHPVQVWSRAATSYQVRGLSPALRERHFHYLTRLFRAA
mgnify:CR=1 FL=1